MELIIGCIIGAIVATALLSGTLGFKFGKLHGYLAHVQETAAKLEAEATAPQLPHVSGLLNRIEAALGGRAKAAAAAPAPAVAVPQPGVSAGALTA